MQALCILSIIVIAVCVIALILAWCKAASDADDQEEAHIPFK